MQSIVLINVIHLEGEGILVLWREKGLSSQKDCILAAPLNPQIPIKWCFPWPPPLENQNQIIIKVVLLMCPAEPNSQMLAFITISTGLLTLLYFHETPGDYFCHAHFYCLLSSPRTDSYLTLCWKAKHFICSLEISEPFRTPQDSLWVPCSGQICLSSSRKGFLAAESAVLIQTST